MPFFILSILLQVGFVLHIVKTGRNTTWIWIVIMLPLAGAFAYFIIELLPELLGTRSGVKARRNLSKLITPNKTIDAAVHDYSMTDTVENSIKLAQACLEKEKFAEAKTLYEKSLSGIHESDPDMLVGLAMAEFGLNDFARCKIVLDNLIAKNPDYKNPKAHLLYAKTLENLDENEAALKEYAVLDSYYAGPEASYHYALLLKKQGENEKANTVLEAILRQADLADKHYRASYKKWIKQAKHEYSH
jgi:hypothetical protein